MSIKTIQSVDRAMAILRLLAEEGAMTASDLAAKLDLNQSTASRQLKSLMEVGFVRKPTFHSFAVDYGLLCFAGDAIRSFPLVGRARNAVQRICRDEQLGAAVCVLHEGDLIYVARRDPGVENATLQLVNHSNWPLHRSSMGLVLACRRGRAFFEEAIGPQLAGEEGFDVSAGKLFERVDNELEERGFFDWGERTGYNFNIAQPFPTEGRSAALGVFSHKKSLTPEIGKKMGNIISEIMIAE